MFEKRTGIATTYFVEAPSNLFGRLVLLSETDEDRCIEGEFEVKEVFLVAQFVLAIVHPARPVKFVGYLMLGSLERSDRLTHVRLLQNLVSKLWAFKTSSSMGKRRTAMESNTIKYFFLRSCFD